MKITKYFMGLAAMLLVLGLFSGCDSGGGGGGDVDVYGSVYMGVGIYDPWYYGPGPGYYPPAVICHPPPRPMPPRPPMGGGGMGPRPMPRMR
jgi:hypothetical protein